MNDTPLHPWQSNEIAGFRLTMSGYGLTLLAIAELLAAPVAQSVSPYFAAAPRFPDWFYTEWLTAAAVIFLLSLALTRAARHVRQGCNQARFAGRVLLVLSACVVGVAAIRFGWMVTQQSLPLRSSQRLLSLAALGVTALAAFLLYGYLFWSLRRSPPNEANCPGPTFRSDA